MNNFKNCIEKKVAEETEKSAENYQKSKCCEEIRRGL